MSDDATDATETVTWRPSDWDDAVTNYTLRIPTAEWRAWRESLPSDTPLYARLRRLVIEDADPSAFDAAPPIDTTTLRVDRETYLQWADTIPRSDALDAHLNNLIKQDMRTARQRDEVEVSPKTVSIFASRIRIRATHAIDELRDDPDPEQAIEYLEELVDVANTLES